MVTCLRYWYHNVFYRRWHENEWCCIIGVANVTVTTVYWYNTLTKHSLFPAYQLYVGDIYHDDVIRRKTKSHYWPFIRGFHRWPVNSPHKGQWHGALMFPLIYAWTNSWANNWDTGDLRRHRAHCDVTVMPRGRGMCAETNLDSGAGPQKYGRF